MHDVARLARVSVKTVSRVVNREPGVHPATAERVHDAIDQLDFGRDSGVAAIRRSTATGTIAVLTDDTSNPFFTTLIQAVQDQARRRDRLVLTASSDQDPDQERELILDFCARQVDGLVVVPVGDHHGYVVPHIRTGTTVVFVDRPAGDIGADTVLVDNAGGMAAAVRHLAQHGHRRVAYLGDAPEIYTAAERLRGFRQGCADAGVRYIEELVAMGPQDQRSVATEIRRVLRRRQPATAILTGNNRITVLVLRALAGMPDRPALIGFDDFELADLLEPKVSVIAQDVAALGKAAADLLFARLDGAHSPPCRLTLPVRLIARGSGEQRPR
jgi:LacI family transcriptional regulator